MLYQSDYFDDVKCHGVIPQIILSSMLLQAGNIRAAKNIITNDQTDSISFNVSGERLTIQGYLPLAEARYLLTVPSLISRVNALNGENVALIGDSIGLPVGEFSRLSSQKIVTLPPNIEHLSVGQLVLEKRLMYLLLTLQKRQNLVSFYNFLRWVYLSSLTTLQTLVATNYQTVVSNADGTTTYENNVVYRWQTGDEVSSFQVINVCIDELFLRYKFLKTTIDNTFNGSYSGENRLERLTEWVVNQLDSDTPEYIPFIDIGYVSESIAEKIEGLFALPPFPVSSSAGITISGDVSSEITSNEQPSAAPNPYGDTLSDNPFTSKDTPNAFTQLPPTQPTPNISPLNKDVPDNSLPEC